MSYNIKICRTHIKYEPGSVTKDSESILLKDTRLSESEYVCLNDNTPSKILYDMSL